MTKREMIEGGLLVLGVGFIAWGAICLIVNVAGWVFCVAVGNQETVATSFAPDFIRTILANILQCSAGYWLIAKNRNVAALMDRTGHEE